MIYRVFADATLTLHLAFILFAVLGGLLAYRWRWLAWIHLPAAGWAVLIAIIGWECPLTPLENHLRRLGGQTGYEESFIERYLVSLIYPEGLDRGGFIVLGLSALAVNFVIYAALLIRGGRS